MKFSDLCLIAALVIGVVHFGPRFMPSIVQGGELKVLVIRESRDIAKLPEEQAEIFLGDGVRSHVESLGGQFRVVDPDSKDIPEAWQPLFVGDSAMIPRMVIARGKTVKFRPLPKNTEAAIAAIQ